MAVEIKELVVRAVLVPEEPQNGIRPTLPELSEDQQERLLAACVKQVLEILKREKER